MFSQLHFYTELTQRIGLLAPGFISRRAIRQQYPGTCTGQVGSGRCAATAEPQYSYLFVRPVSHAAYSNLSSRSRLTTLFFGSQLERFVFSRLDFLLDLFP